jgi:sugar phosphate isomerase/epimerase
VLVLAAGSMLDCDAVTLVEVAATAGFDGVGLRLSGPHQVIDPVGLRRHADGLGVTIHDTEVHRIGANESDATDLIERSAAIGATALLVVSDLSDRRVTVARVSALEEECRRHGLVLGLEYMAWTDPSTSAAAVEVARATGCRVVVDLLHHTRVGEGSDALDAVVGSGTLGWVQLCDAPIAAPLDGDLVHEARHGRLPPGLGELPLRTLLAHVPADVVVSVEVQSDTLLALPPAERACLLHDTARAVLTG